MKYLFFSAIITRVAVVLIHLDIQKVIIYGKQRLSYSCFYLATRSNEVFRAYPNRLSLVLIRYALISYTSTN